MVLEKTLEIPLDCKDIQPVSLEYSLEELMLKLKLQYFDHLMRRTDTFEKTLMLGMIEGRKRRGQHCYATVQVPKTERIRRPQQCKSIKGFYCQLEPGLPSHPAQWSLDESREPRFTAVFISLEQRQGVGKG